jgi:riboflavin synthase alpha subunit
MFTGLVSDVGTILSIEERGELRRIRIACSYDPKTILLGASIACSGPCLTAVEIGQQDGRTFFDIDAAAETLARTTVGTWAPGMRVNLERSLKIGDELGGHIVTGHVDGVADGEQCHRQSFHHSSDPPYALGDDLGRAQDGRPIEYRGRSDGPLRSPAGRGQVSQPCRGGLPFIL